MKIAVRFAAALLPFALVGPASAQTITFQPGSRDVPSRPIGFRVQVQMQVSLATAPGAGVEDQSKQQEAARRALYEMSARECRNLKDTFGGECRLTNLSVNTNIQDRRPAGLETVNATASATYEVAAEPARP